jgi:alpha-D-ribose 1-methylphosphonate 5-triphosphate synthase subunit PhnG
MSSLTYVLSLSSSAVVCELAADALQLITPHTITMIIDPKVAMVQLRVSEGVADTVFNAGEVLVTETRLEVNGQFGFGMIIGNQPEFATALAVIDAVMRIPGQHHTLISTRVAELAHTLQQQQHKQFAASNSTKVEFDIF